MASTKRPKSCPNPIETPSLSAQEVAENDDLLIEILVRLPLKSLITFKSVSIRWLSLISDPHFCRRRLNPLHNRAASGLFLSRFFNSDEISFISLNQNRMNNHFRLPFTILSSVRKRPESIKVLQSCNGLLLCSGIVKPCKGPINRTRIRTRNRYVYNPTTNHYTKLPQPSHALCESGCSDLHFSLAFDPSKSNHYKVVCVRLVPEMEVEIYSSETGLWRLCKRRFFTRRLCPKFPISDFNLHGGVFWNGALHWIGTRGYALYFNLDEDDERLRRLPLPCSTPEVWSHSVRYFGESGGHLHLAGINDSPSTQLNVYELERDYSVDPRDGDGFDLADLSFKIVCVVRCEVEEESYLVMRITGGIVIYGLTTQTFKKLCDIDDDEDDDFVVDAGDEIIDLGWSRAYQYIESLACA
ncbi:hypothetical protein FNV43_RR15159 [Rhamnella rubrinervis]|uniref:F-box domain-containing protein n=1 Tax=Rhamnella rubrinervis TaxID=2594499 RepID=A0A8K0E2U8_9ROSA|nr:hypothetical protein FNV43_RR15159 [Rhamnella rubrinervis]